MQALRILSVMAAIRLDDKSDRIEDILNTTLADGPKTQERSIAALTDPLASSTWEEVCFGNCPLILYLKN